MYNNSWNVTQDDARVPSRWKAFSKGSAFLRPTSHFFLSFRPVCMERGNGSRGLKKRKKKKKNTGTVQPLDEKGRRMPL